MGKKSKKELERQREYNQQYYEQNRDRLLDYRKEKYREDPKYREQMRIRDQRRYWFGERQKTERDELPDVDLGDVKSIGTIAVEVLNPEDPRHKTVVEVPVYGTPEVGQIIDRSSQTIRKWVKRGVLPEPFWRGDDRQERVGKGRNPRLYTEDEMRAIYKHRELLNRPSPKLSESAFSNAIEEEFRNLVQGLWPQVKKRKKTAYG